MGFLRRLLGSRPDANEDAGADAGDDGIEEVADERPRVTAWIHLSDPGFTNEREQQKVFELENRVIAAVEHAGAGTYDTNELVSGAFGMRLAGPDPDQLLAIVRPLLAGAPVGSYLTVRAGGPNASEERVEIDEHAS